VIDVMLYPSLAGEPVHLVVKLFDRFQVRPLRRTLQLIRDARHTLCGASRLPMRRLTAPALAGGLSSTHFRFLTLLFINAPLPLWIRSLPISKALDAIVIASKALGYMARLTWEPGEVARCAHLAGCFSRDAALYCFYSHTSILIENFNKINHHQ
jgi:hypothetical protein